MPEDYEKTISLTLRTRNSKKTLGMLEKMETPMVPAMLCKTCKRSKNERPVARLMISSLNFRVSWKPVNPQECVWKNLYQIFMRTCRSTALYSSSPRNRSTSSSVCKAGALVSPSSCLDGEPHGWVPVDTHSTPVPSLTGEAVGGLRSITSPIDHRKVRNPYMVAEQKFRTTTPEPASQLSSETVSRTAPPGSEPSEDDGSSPPSMEQL